MIDLTNYDEEMAYLREGGKQFASRHPQRAASLRLDSPESADPHVERLIESFAFLTGRIRQRLDADFPELCGAFLSAICPILTCPLPSFTLLEFAPAVETLSERITIPQGACVQAPPGGELSEPVQFRTAAPVDVYPFQVFDVRFGRRTGQAPHLQLVLRLAEGIESSDIPWSNLRLLVNGDLPVRSPLYALLHSHVSGVRVSVPPIDTGSAVLLPSDRWRATPFTVDDALLPQPMHVFGAFRLLYEYFVFPDRYRYFELRGLEFLRDWEPFAELFIDFELNTDIPGGLRVGPDNLRLFTVPAVNLFAADGMPILTDLSAHEYRLEPDLGGSRNHDIYSVDAVACLDPRSGEEDVLPSFLGFLPSSQGQMRQQLPSYQVMRREGTSGRRETWVRFLSFEGTLERPEPDLLSVKLTCTNGEDAAMVPVGGLTQPGEGIPDSVIVSNLTRPTPPLPAPLFRERDLRYWHLLGHASANLLSLVHADVFRGTLELFASHSGLSVTSTYAGSIDARRAQSWRRRIDSIRDVTVHPASDVIHGTPMHGVRVHVVVDDEKAFEERGELLQFMNVLSQFLSYYTSMNSFVELVLQCRKPAYQEVWPWKPGNRPLL